MENSKIAKPVEIVLTFNDVVNLNAFVATSPNYAVLTYKTSRLAKLWMLEIEDDKNRWVVGYDISRFGDVALEYSIDVKRRRHGYIDAELVKRFQELYVVRWKGGYIFIMLPNENTKEVVITAPLVCGRHGAVLMEPVYIWKDVIGWYHILDCGGNGTLLFETLSGLETWLHEKAEGKKLPWGEWYVLGIVSGDEEWVDAVKKAEVGELGPTPHEVIGLVRRLTE